MKAILPVLLVPIVLMTAGCFPQERLWWSPDGRQLAMLAPDGLRLSSPDGLLAPATLEGAQAAAWLPDSSGLVVMRQLKFAHWNEVKNLVPAAEIARIEELAKAIPGLAKALVDATGGDEDRIDPFLKSLDVRDPVALEPAFLCARQTNQPALEAALAGAPDGWRKQLAEDIPFTVDEIAVVAREGSESLGSPKPLVRSLFGLGAPVVSPKHGLVAFTSGQGLVAAALDGSSFLAVAERVTGTCVWSTDGLSLFHLVPTSSGDTDELALAELRTRTVADASGTLLKDTGDLMTPQTCSPATTLAVTACSGVQRLAVLPDGRILFASVSLALPMATRSVPGIARLFLIDPAQGKDARPVAVPADPQSLPGTLQFFAVSPDGKRVALVDSSKDVVAVLELATGKVEVVSPDRGWKCRTLPAWRSNDELAFAALPDKRSDRPEVMVWTAGNPARPISETWEVGIVNTLLEK